MRGKGPGSNPIKPRITRSPFADGGRRRGRWRANGLGATPSPDALYADAVVAAVRGGPLDAGSRAQEASAPRVRSGIAIRTSMALRGGELRFDVATPGSARHESSRRSPCGGRSAALPTGPVWAAHDRGVSASSVCVPEPRCSRAPRLTSEGDESGFPPNVSSGRLVVLISRMTRASAMGGDLVNAPHCLMHRTSDTSTIPDVLTVYAATPECSPGATYSTKEVPQPCQI